MTFYDRSQTLLEDRTFILRRGQLLLRNSFAIALTIVPIRFQCQGLF